MTAVAEVVDALRERTHEEMGLSLASGLPEEEVEARAWALLVELVEEENRHRALAGREPLSAEERTESAQVLFDHLFRLGPLQPFLEDDTVEEVTVNAPDRGFVVRAGGAKERFDTGFASDDEVRSLLARIVSRAGRRIDDASPAVDVRLPGGARLHAIMPPLSRHPCLTIRRHRMVAGHLDDLVALGTVTRELADFLSQAVRGGLNILVSGGTASGKTTTLNVLGATIPPAERVVTIEETAELRLEEILPDCVALEARLANIEGVGQIGIRELVRHALRMRPTRIVVGEVRGPEAVDMLSAMNTGHDGSMGTIHANSARQALSKLRTYVLMAEEQLTAEVANEMIAETLDLVVHLHLDQRSGDRRVVQAAEVAGLEAGRVLTNDLFRLEPGGLIRTGIRPRFGGRLPELAPAPPSAWAGVGAR
ncbi:MAG TPA: ATPase, T2SS/T4P/T4SS family [Actinomycetota bacterium]|nr:ATPase, T2SS/T4P/T4SS family [Actinomycetota bacterium]